jgi:UDPglucose 6-dehydrogenase
MICFLGTSHAAVHLREAAIKRGVPVTNDPESASVLFVSEDTPTDEAGNRNLRPISELVAKAAMTGAQLVLTSQVPPGFTRSLGIKNIYHQAETLRIKDAEARAYNPEYIAVGGPQGISKQYAEYLMAFHCPILRMSWEDAEFSKIAVNMMLAAQVEYTNRLSEAAKKAGADWTNVTKALKLDGRIGPSAYLTPGRWQDSKHLLRDFVTLEAITKEVHWQDAME